MSPWFRFVDWPLRAKLAVLLLVASLLPLAVAAIIEIRETRERMVVSADALLSARGDQLADQLDAFHRNYQRAADRFSRLPETMEFCQAANPVDRSRLGGRIQKLMQVWPAGDANVRGVALLDLSGTVILGSEERLLGVNLAYRGFVQEALRGTGVVTADIYFADPAVNSVPTIAYLRAVHGADGKVTGLVAFWVHATALWNVMKAANGLAGPGSFAVLLDHQGIRIGHTFSDDILFHPAGRLESAALEKHVAERRFGPRTRALLEDVRSFPEQFERARAAAPDPGVFRGFAPGNQKWNYGVSRRFATVPWTVFYMIPEDAFNAEMARVLRQKTLFAVGIIVLALAAGTLFGATILRPVSSLAAATKRIAAGDLAARVSTGRADELGRLQASFNAMAGQIETQATALRITRDELELRVQERTAELRQKTAALEVEVSERKRAELSLRATQARLNSTLAAGSIGTWTWDIARDQLVADEFTAWAFGLAADAAVQGLPASAYLQAVLAEDQPAVSADLARAIETCGQYDIEYRVRHQDGSLLWLQARGRVEGDAAGRAVRFHGAVMDITARKQAEAEVRESAEHFRFLNDLTDATRALADPAQIMAVTARLLGGHLRVSRCAYAEVAPDSEQFTILHDYTDGCASTVGQYQLSLFGPRAVATLRAGQTLILRHVAKELAPGEGAEMFHAIGIQAIITCPLVKEGELRAMMAVHQATPRDWLPREITLVQDVVERCWATIARLTAENSLRQREALLRIAGRSARLGGWTVDLPEVRITWSDEVCAIHGMPPGTVPGLERAMSFYAPRSRESIQKVFALCVEEGVSFDVELEMTTAQGAPIWVRSIGEAQRSVSGAITRVQGAFQEITERKQAEEEIRRLNAELEQRVVERTGQLEAANEELRRSRAIFVNLFESLPGPYLVLTPDLRIVSASDAYTKATMTTRAAIIGRGLFEVFPDNPADLDATGMSNLLASLNRVRETAAPDTMAIQKYDVRRPEGTFEERYWSPINSPVLGADGQIEYILHRVEDVTDFVRKKSVPASAAADIRNRMEQMEAEIFQSSQKVQATNLQLEEANKELEAFSYSVSHDLRAPLRAVDGFSQAVIQDFGAQLPEEGRRQLQTIRDSAQRMGALIDDLLAFSRLGRQALKQRTVDTQQLVQDALQELGLPGADHRVEVRTGKLPPCLGDRALLKQVWLNLLDNARKYSQKSERPVIEIGAEQRPESLVVYHVRDNGTGFDMQYAGKLFGVFQRLHRMEDYEGTGVGLATVQRIIHRHGGRVWAEAEVDRGATFYFTLQGETP